MGRTPEQGRHPAHPVVQKTVEVLGTVLFEPVHIEGEEHLHEAATANRPVIFVANHRAHADGPVIDAALRAKKFPKNRVYIQGIKLNKVWYTRLGTQAVDRIHVWPPSLQMETEEDAAVARDMNQAALRSSADVLKGSESLVIFPEAQRGESLREVHPAISAYLTIVKDTLVVPVGLIETEKITPPGKRLVQRHRPTVRFGAPLDMNTIREKHGSLGKDEKRKAVIDDVMGAIAELLPEEYRGVYSKRARFYDASR